MNSLSILKPRNIKFSFKYIIAIFLFGVISLDNGTIIMKSIKLLLVGVSILYIILKNKIVFNSILKISLISLLYSCLSIFWASSVTTAIDASSTLLLNYLCYFCYFQLISDDSITGIFLLKCFAVFPLFYFLRMIFKYGITSTFTGLRNISGEQSSMHNAIGFVSAIGASISFVLFFNDKRKYKSINLFFCLANIFILILSGSRKSIIYFLVPLFFYFLLKKKNSLILLRNLFLTIVFLIFLFILTKNIPFLYNMVGEGLENAFYGFVGKATDASTSTRIRLVDFGNHVYLNSNLFHKIFGYGLENFKYLHLINYGIERIADNNYVELLVDQGILGLVIYYSLYILIFYDLIRKRRKYRKNYFYILFIGILISILICDYGSCTYRSMDTQLLILTGYTILTNNKILKKEKI